ncbi:hypothetical protein T310_9150, partial [Rasamsonia emersonii CBS 393.64]
VLATAAAARAKHAGRPKRRGLVRASRRLESPEVVTSDLAGRIVLRRLLIPEIAGEIARISTAKRRSTAPVGLLAETLHLSLLLLTGSLQTSQ